MAAMRLADVLAMPDVVAADTLVQGIQLDSRKVSSGDLFLAVPGEIHDGRQFIEQAVANGAAAVAAEPPVDGFIDAVAVPVVELPELQQEAGWLASRFYGEPSSALHMVGVTGTNGKTTISRLLAQLVRMGERSCGVIGTLGATLEEDVQQGGNTTPDAVSLQRTLGRWRDQGVYAVSMEVSSHALVQGRVNGVQFETAVFSNLSHDHLDYHGSMDAYGRAKLQLFAMEGLRHVLVNADDAFAAQVCAVVEPGVQVLTYSLLDPGADIFVERAEFGADGVQGLLRTPWGTGAFNSPLPGDFNLANLAASVSAAVLSGQSLDEVLATVPRLRSVPGRMQLLPTDCGVQVIIDYAHTPDALEQVLVSLKPHVSGRLIAVFGCGGDRDRNKRQIMGRVACQLADHVVLTSDNPRSEDPLAILADIETGCSGSYELQVDRATAIATAVREARVGDCVVIAGKGHEDYQVVEGDYLHFSDEEHARAALAERASS